jgi:TonB family protein
MEMLVKCATVARSLVAFALTVAPAFTVPSAMAADTVMASTAQAPAGVQQYQAPVFPQQLRGSNISDGYATVTFTVSESGHIDDALILEASHVAFAEAVLRVLPNWLLTPGSTQTLPRREVVEFDFKRSGVVTTASHFDAAKAAFPPSRAGEVQIAQWAQLEAPPQRTVTVMPKLAKTRIAQLDKEAKANRVVVSFVIDQEGRVRVPIVAASTEPYVAGEVLTAIKQWRYTPPIYQGKPIAVEVTRVFALSTAVE